MGWPIDRADFEELNFEYTAGELGIDTRNAAKIQAIKRLRPLPPSQPWGIFFVRFAPKRLPVVALRRILSQIALKCGWATPTRTRDLTVDGDGHRRVSGESHANV